MDDTNELLHLLVDAINNGLRDANGSLSKQNVERVILHHLNANTRFPKTYNHYLSWLKWLKNQYNKISTLMRNNSDFRWDTVTKTFTASDEVWEDYLKPHPSHGKLREKSAVDYEELKIVFGGTTAATGNGSIALGTNDTDATTFGEENRDSRMKDFVYDPINDAFITPNHYKPLNQSPSSHQCSPPSHSPSDSKIHTEKTSRNKRSRSEYEGNSTSVRTKNQAKVLENLSIGIETIASYFEKIYNLMEERERDRKKESNIWDAIKEISNLEDKTRFLVVDLHYTKEKKDLFLSMSVEERFSWIKFKLG